MTFNNPTGDIVKALADAVEKAAYHYHGAIRQTLNQTQPYRIYGKKNKWYRGLDPSLPGQPAKKIRGYLQQSFGIDVNKEQVKARVGSRLDRAAWLERGTRTIEPRPTMQIVLDRERGAMERILASARLT